MAEVSKPARQVSQYTRPCTLNGLLIGRLPRAKAGSTHRTKTINTLAIFDIFRFHRARERERERKFVKWESVFMSSEKCVREEMNDKEEDRPLV